MLEITEKVLSPAERLRTDVLRVNEIFYSIQGEGSRAGERCIFVRLTGCGLRCSYCDTEYAFYEGSDTSIAEVLDSIRAFDCRLIELTGGEPLEQEGVYSLIDLLLSLGYEVMIETGGHIDVGRVNTKVKRIVDLKTPSSGMSKRNYFENMHKLTTHDEVKFVIGDRNDYDWALEMIQTYGIDEHAGTILFSPVSGVQSLESLTAWMLADSVPARLQVQLHKLIWPTIERGV